MSETFVIAPLDCDAFAVRSNDDLLVHLSPEIPRWAMPAVVEHLRSSLDSASGCAAAVSLPAGEAIVIARDARPSLPTIPTLGQLVPAVAAITLLDSVAVIPPQPEPLWDPFAPWEPDCLSQCFVDPVDDGGLLGLI